jgi:hypothetical protein
MRTPLIALTLAVLAASSAHADVTMSDGEFNVVNWALTVTAATNGATQTTSRLTIGGNPDAYRRTVHVMTANSSITVAHVYQGASYDPAVDGPIYAIDYDEDQIQETPPFPGAFISATPLLQQGGVFYYGPDITFVNTVWLQAVRSGLVATDFTSGTNTHPDFSANGGVIRFGYARSNINPGALAANFRSGIDNWSVHVISGVVGVTPPAAAATLRLVGPNPFRSSVAFEASSAVRVHDASGRLVRTLARGFTSWDGSDDAGRVLPAGLYFLSVDRTTQRVVKVN